MRSLFGANPENRRPIVHRCPSQYGAFSGCGGNAREIGGGPALVNRRISLPGAAFRPLPSRIGCASVRPHSPGEAFPHPKDRPMHSLVRPLVRTRFFPLVCAALLAALALSLALTLRAGAQDTDKVVARVNGTDIKASDIAIAEEDIGAN